MTLLRDLAQKGPEPIWVRYLLLIGFFTLTIRIILDSQFRYSSVLYILVPYLVAVAIYIFVPQPKGQGRFKRFLKHVLAAVTIMLATSAVLFEGFLCVLMFMPIYLIVAAMTFLLEPKPYYEKKEKDRALKASFFPLIILIMSIEGITQQTSFPRYNVVTQSKIVALDTAAIKHNLAQPIQMAENRSAFLSLFPLPENIKAGSLNAGDIHKVAFVYKRWGFTNVHRGETWVKIAEVGDHHVRTEIIKDTSYFSKYLKVSGTLIEFEELENGQTNVTLTVRYKRLLDPAWYFHPLQKAAMNESARYLLEEVITREHPRVSS